MCVLVLCGRGLPVASSRRPVVPRPDRQSTNPEYFPLPPCLAPRHICVNRPCLFLHGSVPQKLTTFLKR